jgi:hypothetical protein
VRPSSPFRMSVWPNARCTFTPAGTIIIVPSPDRRRGAELFPRRCLQAQKPAGHRPVRPRSCRRPAARTAQCRERRHLIRCAVGERDRRQLRCLSSAQTELDPLAEEQAGSDAMAAANLRHGNTRLLRLLHHCALLLVGEAAPVRSPVSFLRCQAILIACAISSAA